MTMRWVFSDGTECDLGGKPSGRGALSLRSAIAGAREGVTSYRFGPEPALSASWDLSLPHHWDQLMRSCEAPGRVIVSAPEVVYPDDYGDDDAVDEADQPGLVH